MEQNVCPGKTLLKVVGIIMIVFGVISIILSLVALVAGGAMTAVGVSVDSATLQAALSEAGADVTPEAVAGVGAVALLAGVIMLISSAFELVLGILGLKHCANPEKAKLLLVLGIISLVLSALSLLGGFSWSSLIGLVLPILYVLGASMNKKAA